MLKQFQESEYGYLYTDTHVSVFFGKANADQIYIEKEFSNFEFHKLQQIHSDKLVLASSAVSQADAHWTANKKTGLLISTADCIPVLIWNTVTKKIAAVHAGWKGVCNQITYKTLKALSTESSTAKDFSIWIGPHILKPSFEVKQDVLDQLLNSTFEKNKDMHYQLFGEKIFVDLKSILLSQVKAAIGNDSKIADIHLDTQTNLFLNSYRRNQQSPKRNLSFIALN